LNDQACRYGLASGYTCGQINKVNVSRDSEANGRVMHLAKAWQVDFDSTSGDSGGPMLYPISGTNNRIALGTHVHSVDDNVTPGRGWYSPFDIGRTTFSGLHGYSYLLCYTSVC
jgi:hypothetical protein